MSEADDRIKAARDRTIAWWKDGTVSTFERAREYLWQAREDLFAAADERYELRIKSPCCSITGHPCGTDTWNIGNPPDCLCGRYVRRIAELERDAAFLVGAVDGYYIRKNGLMEFLGSGEGRYLERLSKLERENAALLAILRRVDRGEIKPTIGDLGMEVHIARGGTTD